MIAFVLALPAAWYSVTQWLDGYAYKTDMGVPVYLLAGGLTLLISLATISFQSIKAARSNPWKVYGASDIVVKFLCVVASNSVVK